MDEAVLENSSGIAGSLEAENGRGNGNFIELNDPGYR